MRFGALVCSMAAAMAVMVKAEEDAVLTLTDATFDDYIKAHDYVLAEFYAPWCGHCKSLAPEYEKAAKALKVSHPEVTLAKIDATAEKAVAAKFEVGGFPTLKWIVKGEAKEYQGGRTEPTIVSWISKKVGAAAKPIHTVEEFEAFKAASEVVVLGLFNNEAEAAGYLATAQSVDDLPFGIAIGEAAVSALKNAVGCASGAPFIVLFKKFDEGVAIYEGDSKDTASITTFVSGNSLPLIINFTQESASKIFGGALKQHLLLFVDGTVSGQKDAVVAAATPTAKKNVGKYLFVTVDKSEARIVEYFGIKAGDYPAARIVELGEGMRKYKMDSKEITEASIAEFVKAHGAGELQLDLKSEEIPASQPDDVFTLVAKQYKDIVKGDKHKNVLLEVYAPWCGHCKKLAPIYEEIAKKYKKFDNLIIAKMDGTQNEVADLTIAGFPTLKFYPAGSDEIVDYSGGRELADISKFLEEKIPGLAASATQ